MIRILPAILFLFLIIASSCGLTNRTMKRAHKKFDRGEYEVSIDMYHKALKKRSNAGEANFYIGESYRLSNRLKQALPYYQAAIKNGNNDDNARYYLAQALKVNEKYDEALQVIQDLEDKASDDNIRNLSRLEVTNLNELDRLINKKNYYKVKNLEAINTPGAEYSPVYNNGELFYTSSREGGKIYKATGTAYTGIYKVKTTGAKVDMTTLQPLDALINDADANEGSVTFSADGKTLIFAKGNTGKKRGAKDVDLFITNFRRGKWTPPRPIQVNDPDAWDSSPS